MATQTEIVLAVLAGIMIALMFFILYYLILLHTRQKQQEERIDELDGYITGVYMEQQRMKKETQHQ